MADTKTKNATPAITEDEAIRLTIENDELRAKVAELEAKVAGAATEPEKPRFLLSEGVRVELETHGQAVDPATGGVLTLDRETGEITVKDRKGGTITAGDVASLNAPRQ